MQCVYACLGAAASRILSNSHKSDTATGIKMKNRDWREALEPFAETLHEIGSVIGSFECKARAHNPPIPALPCFKCGVVTNETQSVRGVGHYKCLMSANVRSNVDDLQILGRE